MCSGSNIEQIAKAAQEKGTRLSYYNTETHNITILKHDPDNRTLRHEECHQRQHQEGRLYGCRWPLFAMINEIECYIGEEAEDSMQSPIHE